MGLEDAEDLAARDALNKGDTVLVTEQDADLRRHLTLLRRLRNHLLHLDKNQHTHQPTNQPNNGSRRRRRMEFDRGEEKALTSAAAVLTQAGGVLLYGSADDEIPFLRHGATKPPLARTDSLDEGTNTRL
jgi:hypothetical protein